MQLPLTVPRSACGEYIPILLALCHWRIVIHPVRQSDRAGEVAMGVGGHDLLLLVAAAQSYAKFFAPEAILPLYHRPAQAYGYGVAQ